MAVIWAHPRWTLLPRGGPTLGAGAEAMLVNPLLLAHNDRQW